MSAFVKQDPMAQHFVECEYCETRPAQHFCNTCPRSLCEICKEEHKQKQKFQNHEIIPLVSSRKQTTSFCTDHRTNHCDLYCKQCKQPVCSKCIAEKHKGHIIEKLSSYLEEQRKTLMQYIHRISKTLIPAYENLLTETKTNHAQVIKFAAEASSSIQKKTENLILAVKSAESGILAVLEKNKHQALISIESDQSVISYRITRLNEIKKVLQEMHGSNSVDQTWLKQQIPNIEELETLPEVMATPFKFVPGNVETSQLKNHICNLTLLRLCKIQKLRLNKSSNLPRFVRLDGKLMKKPIRKTEVKVDVAKLWEIRCKNTNTAMVLGNDNKIRIVDITGTVTKITTTLPEYGWPRGMDITKDNDIIYTDARKRKVMRVCMNGNISTLFTLRTDFFPNRLFVTRSGSILISFVLKAHKHDQGQRGKVVEYTTSGQIVKEFIKHGGREIFKRPRYVVQNPVNDDIMVSDYVLHKVIALTGKGNLKFEYNGTSKSGEFWPKQITCDSLCQILIADQFSDSIHIINDDGHRLAIMTCELYQPMSVCFDGFDSIWTGGWTSNKIKIFKYLE